MSSYGLAGLAERDLAQIADFTIGRWGIAQARKYRDGLKDAFRRLADNPRIGKDVGDFRQGYRHFRYKSHMIFYRVEAQGVLFVRILHSRMDFARHL